jgi:hypothetical protein
MKIVIEHDSAITSCTGNGYLPPILDNGSVLLDLTLEKQERDKWCWAAIAVSLANYYYGEKRSQFDIVSRVLAAADYTPGGRVPKECYNLEYNLDKALKEVGCWSHWSPGKPNFERIQFEINAGRPLCCRIEWYHGNAHYILIRGYTVTTREVYVEDSLHGSHKMPFDNFPSHYKKAGGVWTETYWTQKEIKI